jgi:hypothetical protein
MKRLQLSQMVIGGVHSALCGIEARALESPGVGFRLTSRPGVCLANGSIKRLGRSFYRKSLGPLLDDHNARALPLGGAAEGADKSGIGSASGVAGVESTGSLPRTLIKGSHASPFGGFSEGFAL